MVLRSRVFCLCLIAIATAGCSKQDSKEALLKRASEYLAAGQYRKAEQDYREVLRTDPTNQTASQELAVLYYDQGQLRQAYPLLKKSAEEHPDNLELQLKLALTHFSARDHKKARELAHQIIDKRPEHLEALLLMVDTAATPDDIQETQNTIDKLKGSDQGRVAYHVARGALDLRQKNDASAENEFKAALNLDPKSSFSYSALGALYWSRQDIAAAAEAFKTAAELSPPRSPARLRYVDFKYRTGATAEATKLAEEIARETPDYLPPRVYLMKVTCEQKQDEGCETQVDNILAQDPFNYDALLGSGLLNLKKGTAARAIRIFEHMRGMNERDPQVRYQLALAYLLSRKDATPVASRNALDNAESNLNTAIQLDANLGQAAVLLAEIKIQKGAPAAAVELLTPITKNHPQFAQAHYLLASAHLAQQQQDQALVIYRRVAELFPKDPQAPFLIGRILLGRRQLPEARKEFEKSTEMMDYLPAVEALVNLDIVDKQYAVALERVQKLIDKTPNEAQVWAIRGKIYLAQRDFAHAEPDLARAIELSPDLEPAYQLLAQLYVASNRNDEAIAKLSEAVEKNKDNKVRTIPTLMQLALLQSNLERFDAARGSYEKILEIAPNQPTALNNLAFLYAEHLGQLDKAYDLAKRANETAPNVPQIADTLGWVLFKKGEYASALRLLQDSALKLPQSPEVQFHVGMAHYMMGDETAARTALQKVVDSSADFSGKDDARRRLAILSIRGDVPNAAAQGELDDYLRDRPNDPMALLRRAQLQERHGPPEQAITTYEATVQSNPQFAPALRRLAIVYARSNQFAKASDVAQKARQAYPDDPHVADALGWIQFKNGAYDKALPLLKDSASKLVNEPEAQFHLGMAHYMLGEEGPARVALQKAVNASDDFPDKAEARRRLELLSTPTGDFSAARPRLESFLRENPNDPFALFQLAHLEEQKGAVQQAIGVYEKILSSNANFSPALRQLVLLYGSNVPPDLNRAFEIATQARRAFPDDPQIAKALGILNYRRGFFPQAVEQLKAVTINRNDDAELLYYLGATYHQLKQHRECKEMLERALALDLATRLADQAKATLSDCSQ